jgi:predicted Zn-dependent protease
MSKTGWTLDQAKSALSSKPEIKGWVLTEEHIHRRERYFMKDGGALIADQDRNVRQQNIFLRMFVRLKGKEGRQGEITQKLFRAMPLAPQLESAIAAASQTDHQAWELPQSLPKDVPLLKTADPKMAEDLEHSMSEAARVVERAVGEARQAAFNSAELFLSVHDRALHLSNGLVHRSSQSRVYAEAAYSHSKKDASGSTVSDEYMNTRWSVRLEDADIDGLFTETAERALHMLDVVKPQAGKYSVIIDSEVLATLFNGHVSQLMGGNIYHGLPHVKPGADLIPEAHGDLISLSLDPHLAFGGDTSAISDLGVMQKPIQLVKDNKVIASATDKQYADYLGLQATTSRGDVVVEPGKMSYEELTKAAPQVLEILQFSGLFADPNSGTFSSEIRLARLFDSKTGKVTYLKGGSLSGSITENFKNAKFSSKRVKRAHFQANELRGQGYWGPEFALLSDVSIAG